MKNIIKSIFLLFATGLILTGCATSRGELDLSGAMSNKNVSSLTAKTVIIDKYTDNRVFATNADSPDKPTYDPSKGLDDETKSKIIARKRNGFGKALGDIVLANGLTSEKLIKNIVSQAFVESGYRIVTEDPDGKAVHVDIVVDKFWGWFRPGFWTISVYANTELTLEMKHDLKSEKIHVFDAKRRRSMAATGGLWQDVFYKNLYDVRKNIEEKIQNSELLNNLQDNKQ